MIYTVIYSPVAIETFDEITKQINNRWGDRYVDEFTQRTIKVIETIRSSPFIFQVIESNVNVRKGVIHKNCSVFYEIRDTTIDILFFWDNRQNPIL
ncbi:type II toxin-antitoxin system RelE/ParE family toxin [Mucilaginibacter sp. UYCu711]|uniref:type II toxin-antitoxin system RelE/ParE family toxin n=1 Tax=Mucilaginibacter sp. UYCu711 TaxID=3156339 RepID=UPI003D1E21D8